MRLIYLILLFLKVVAAPPVRSFRTTLFLFEMAGYVEQEHEYVYSSAKNFAGLINSMEIDEL
jgi:hypothetical protein